MLSFAVASIGKFVFGKSIAMAPMAISDGAQNGMPLTEYSANASSNPAEKTPASSLLPDAFLLSDGHPDVCKETLAPLDPL